MEVSGVSKSPYVKALAKELGIDKEDYHKFVADYMYHKDNLETERENLQGARTDLDAKANEIMAASEKIANPSDAIMADWVRNDTENNKRVFDNNKVEKIKSLQSRLKTLNDRLEKEALTNSQKEEVQDEITSVEEALENTKAEEFDASEKISYAQARFDRINTIARIQGTVRQLNFLNGILSAMSDDNITGREFVQKQIDATKKLLNGYLTGNQLRGK
jgi:chromosome segregation ATPase